MAWKSKKASSIANFETTDKVYILVRGNQQLEKKKKRKDTVTAKAVPPLGGINSVRMGRYTFRKPTHSMFELSYGSRRRGFRRSENIPKCRHMADVPNCAVISREIPIHPQLPLTSRNKPKWCTTNRSKAQREGKHKENRGKAKSGKCHSWRIVSKLQCN